MCMSSSWPTSCGDGRGAEKTSQLKLPSGSTTAHNSEPVSTSHAAESLSPKSMTETVLDRNPSSRAARGHVAEPDLSVALNTKELLPAAAGSMRADTVRTQVLVISEICNDDAGTAWVDRTIKRAASQEISGDSTEQTNDESLGGLYI